ncbi:MAG: hypothetical protein WBR13_14750 [Allosphingosinicella sp.]
MTGDSEDVLPLHDEAKARSKWRGGETRDEGEFGAAGPASEVDDSARGDRQESGDTEDRLLKDVAQSPPD